MRDVFSLPRWRLKSNSRSIEDSSSVSLREDMVAELALLSEELEDPLNEWYNGNSASMSIDPSLTLHFRFTPFEEEEEQSWNGLTRGIILLQSNLVAKTIVCYF